MTEREYKKELLKLHLEFWLRRGVDLAIVAVPLFCFWRLGLIEILVKTPLWAWCFMGILFCVCWILASVWPTPMDFLRWCMRRGDAHEKEV